MKKLRQQMLIALTFCLHAKMDPVVLLRRHRAWFCRAEHDTSELQGIPLGLFLTVDGGAAERTER
jgi:hypothetical protein